MVSDDLSGKISCGRAKEAMLLAKREKLGILEDEFVERSVRASGQGGRR